MSLGGNTTLLNQLKAILANKAAGSGGGVSLPILSNPGDASKLLLGYELIGQNGEVVTGEIPSKRASDLTASGKTVTVPAGYYPEQVSKDVATAAQATPSISVSTGGLITASASQSGGYVEAGSKSATKQLTVQAAQTITPGTVDQTIASGRYLTGAQTVKGDANLKAENIVSGVTIFGVAGTAQVGGSGGTTTPETCSAYIEVYTVSNFMVVYTVIENGMEVTYAEQSSNTVDVSNLKKGSLVVVYAPNNSSNSATGSAESIATSSDYACIVYSVTGDCEIVVN